MPTDRSPGAATGAAGLTIEGIVAVESPREFRINPRERVVAYTAEMAGARQLFTLSLRGTGTAATQITASEKAIGEPQWSPDGRRLAFVGDEVIWIVEADGSRFTKVIPKPGGGRDPQWSPDGYDDEGHGWDAGRTGATRSNGSSGSSRPTYSRSRPERSRGSHERPVGPSGAVQRR